MTYKFKTKPFKHQEEVFHRTLDVESYALFWEQGTGKTKPVIDYGCHLFEQGKIDGLLVVAPSGVERNWRTDELPAHVPDRLHSRIRTCVYQTSKATTKWHLKELDQILKHQGLAILLMSYDAFMSERGKKFVWKFLRQRRCLYVADEAHNIKTPKAKRTQAVVASAKYAPYRRLLTGTPIAQGPFDVYSQVKFVDENFWRKRGLSPFSVFKQHFGVWFTAAEHKALHGYDPGYDKLIEYRNLDKLQEMLKEVGSRVTKDEVLDLPPKLYSKRYHDLNSEQRRVYDQLKEEFFAELEDGRTLEAPLAIVRLLRFQQVACGYAQVEAEEPATLLGKTNPRMELLEDIVGTLGHKAIIWARFRKDIDQIMDLLGKRAVRYDGSVSEDECERNKLEFQRGDAEFFVGNQQKGGSGLTLHAARTVIYYSNSFKLIDRLQSEDRAHRIGQEHPVNYIDIIAPGTVDVGIVNNLRGKFDIATLINGDKLREWI